MEPDIGIGIKAAWLSVCAVWVLTAFQLKPVKRSQPLRQRVIRVLAFHLPGGLLLFTPWPHLGMMDARLWPPSAGVSWAAVMLAFAGALVAIAARLYLGSNWSGRPSIKEGHELIRSGPYAFVRHPIYTGLILCVLATALGFGRARCLLAVPLVVMGFWVKVRAEENLMVEAFGEQYVTYRQVVKSAMIPFIL